MRPIDINVQNQQVRYLEDDELNRTVNAKVHDVSSIRDQDASAKRRRTGRVVETASIEDVMESMETLLVTKWDPESKWDAPKSRRIWRRLIDYAGTGYKHASADLITLTGKYCSLCDTPLLSGLSATPIKPLKWFPHFAFDFNNLLLICPACNAARDDNPKRNDAHAYALPTEYWKGSGDNPLLPFEYKLVKTSGFEITPSPVSPDLIEKTLTQAYQLGFIQVARSDHFHNGTVTVDLGDLVSIHSGAKKADYPKFNDLYQLFNLADLLGLNRLKAHLDELHPLLKTMNSQFKNFTLADLNEDEYTLDGLRLHFRLTNTPEVTDPLTKLLAVLTEFKLNRTITFAVHISTRRFLPKSAELQATFDLFKLNDTVLDNKKVGFLDRRVELRTIAFFEAISLRNHLNLDYETLAPRVLEQLQQKIAATGYWGIWLHVFGHSIQPILREVMPGTAPVIWRA